MFHRWNGVVILIAAAMLAPAVGAQGRQINPGAMNPGAMILAPTAQDQRNRERPGAAVMAATKAPGPAESVLGAWNAVGNKLISMAKDFPADKYNYKPTPEVRSFAEILLHVAAVDEFVPDVAAGRKTGAEDLPRSEYNTKEKVVAEITKAVEDGAATIRKEGDRGIVRPVKSPFGGQPMALIAFAYEIVEHSGEHYGNLVTYYRLNHIVPPASRPRPKR